MPRWAPTPELGTVQFDADFLKEHAARRKSFEKMGATSILPRYDFRFLSSVTICAVEFGHNLLQAATSRNRVSAAALAGHVTC